MELIIFFKCQKYPFPKNVWKTTHKSSILLENFYLHSAYPPYHAIIGFAKAKSEIIVEQTKAKHLFYHLVIKFVGWNWYWWWNISIILILYLVCLVFTWSISCDIFFKNLFGNTVTKS